MHVCLINPPRIQPKSWGKPNVFQPLDIAYTAAVLEKQYEIHIIDAPNEGWKSLEDIDGKVYRQGLTNKQIAARIKQCSPAVIGITVPFSGWWTAAYEVASIAKNIDKDITIVLNGLHPSARPAECLTYPNIDFVVIGEPEQTMFELMAALEEGNIESTKKVKGIGFMQNGKNIFTPARPAIQDLDSLPFPARHLLPMDTYFSAVKETALRGEINKRWTVMITSRGCPNNCIFCSVHVINGRKWRSRRPENVVDEIEHLAHVYRIRQIDFNDDNLTLDKKRMEDICDLIKKRGIDIEWYNPTGVRADALDEKLLTKMKASGCKKLRVAPESGVQRIVDQVIKKNQSLKDVENAVILCKRIGIKVGVFFAVGFIGETKEDIRETINYAKKLKRLGASSFVFSIATPLFGTELYQMAKNGGYLRECFNDRALSEAEPLIETPEFTADDLRRLCAEANLVNPVLTRDKLAAIMRNPKKVVKFLFYQR